MAEVVKVRFGRRIFKATRMENGNWEVVDIPGREVRIVTQAEFAAHYERVPEIDHQAGRGA